MKKRVVFSNFSTGLEESDRVREEKIFSSHDELVYEGILPIVV